jgi:hypothetical protein
MITSEFTAAPLFEPMRYQKVGEGDYATASLSQEITHLATFGLYVCKAVSIYNPDTQVGLLAHIDGTVHPEKVTESIVDAFGGDISDTEVTIARSEEGELEFMWPSLDAFAQLFEHHNPGSLRLERNAQRRQPRGFALCLESGCIYEASPDDAVVLESTLNPKPSKPIRGEDALWF